MIEAVTSGQAQLAVEVLGSGPPAVALHSGITDRRSWGPLARALDGTLGLVAYDRRGVGDTTAPAEPHRPTDDLERVLDAVAGDAPTWLVANSQGGRIAVDFALAAPGRVAGLVLIAPALGGETWEEPALEGPAAELVAALAAAEAGGDLDAVNRLQAHLWLDGPTAPEGRVGGHGRELLLEANGRRLRAPDVGEELPPPVPGAAAQLAELQLPILVLLGDLDLPGVLARGRRIADTAPAARVFVLANCAHLPQLERPTQVAAAIRTLLAVAAG
jgi:pimeloyl-ACP methyl ester carboxylesterase